MADAHIPDSVLLVVAVFSRHASARQWAREHLQTLFGPIGLVSPEYEFNQTAYYEPTMGAGLRKSFFTFERLVPADSLPALKRQTNALETELAADRRYPEARPLNLDPGLLMLGKFQLATTKDQAHRIYLTDGIFAEVTLRFEAGSFEPWPWTYADYRQELVRDFLREAREYYKVRLRDAQMTYRPT